MYVSPQDWGIWSVWIMIRWMPMISTLLRGEKYLKNCDKSHVHDEEYQEKQQTPYFHTSTTAREYKIGNNDFTTILGSVNVKNMTPTTICSSNPTENVLGGSIDHTESPWTLNITSALLTSRVDLIFGSKNRFITFLTFFTSGSLHEVAYLGSEFIGLNFMCTEYTHFSMRHTNSMCPSYPTKVCTICSN